MTVTAAVIVALLHLAAASDCVLDHRSKQNSWEMHLHKELEMKIYNMSSTCTTNVRVRLILRKFSLDANEETIRMTARLVLAWWQPELAWDPHRFGGVEDTSILISSYLSGIAHLSNPQIIHLLGGKMLNTDAENFNNIFYVDFCSINSTGYITSISNVIYDTKCWTYLHNWPFDLQNCTFNLKKWEPALAPSNTVLNFGGRALSMFGAEYGTGWDILGYEQHENPNGTVHLSFTLTLERKGEEIQLMLVTPAVTAAIVTVATFFLDGNTRLGILCFSLLAHFTLIDAVSWQIPHAGRDTPTILLFIRDSVIITTLLVAFAIGLKKLEVKTDPVPSWIVRVDEAVDRCGKFAFLVRRQVGGARGWTVFAHLLNNVILLFVVITYLVMCLILIPRRIPFVEPQ